MNKRIQLVKCVLIACCMAAFSGICTAQNSAEIHGKVLDTAGALIPNAAVTLTDLSTNKATHTMTGADGQFVFHDVPTGPQVLAVEKSGFESFTEHVSRAQPNVSVTLTVSALAETVVVRGTVDPEARPVPTREDVMLMPDTVRVLDRKQLDTAGPVAGGAQMIQSTPGANVMGYGETGGTKYSIMLNGIPQGWAGENTSFTEPGSLGITFDGIPVVDPATGLWQSATLPQNLVMQNLGVVYGPGQPMDRWFTNIGGSVEFTPIQPTLDRHLSAAITDGPYGQQDFAFVGNTGKFRGWGTVLGGGLGRGDDYLQGPDGFGNHSQNGSAFGKTIKDFSAGSVALGILYAKAGGFRPTTIPTTDVGLLIPGTNTHFSQATSGYYEVMPYLDYNKYDTNEMFLAYAREHLFLSNNTSVENTTYFNHIRRFHRRNESALVPGTQVNEWNNPYSDIFGDEASMALVLPLNTVNFGGYLMHEVYNSHNIFYNPNSCAPGDPSLCGSGKQQIVSPGAKFRSGYFQQDNVAFFAQDDFHPIPRIHIIPGVRVDGFGTSYSDQAFRDFTVPVAQGVIPSTHCSLFASGSDPFHNIFGTPTTASDGNTTTDQGSLCGEHASDNAVEPSIDVSVTPWDWLTIYGGYETTYRSPSLGGGGGMFQKVDPAYYILAEGKYSQFGGKVHFTNAPGLRNFIAGVDYYHLDYTNQELDYETASGVLGTAGGNSAYHGVDVFFDADPRSNLHFAVNFSGETANYTTYALGNSLSACNANPSSCQFYNNLPVSYTPNFTLNALVYYGIQHHNHELLEPRFWLDGTGSQHMWNNLTGGPDQQTMPSYTTANVSIIAPLSFLEKQSVNLQVDFLNLANSRYNQFEYISSGAYFGPLFPNQNNIPTGYINGYPGAPRSIYGTVSYQF